MKQIKIMELRGTYKGGGGPDKTILLSAAIHDQKKYWILVVYLRNPHDREFQIGQMAKSIGVKNYIEIVDEKMVDLRCILKLTRIIRKNKIQIIHVHDLKSTLLGVILKSLNPRVKIMHTAHGWIVNSKIDKLKQQLQFLLLRFYSLHIAVSDATRKIMVGNNIRPFTIKKLYNSIDTVYWKKNDPQFDIRREFGIPGNSILIGTVGRLSPEKGLFTLLNVAKAVIYNHPRAIFLLVGDGHDHIKKELFRFTKKLGIENSVIFAGHRTDLKKIYSSLDLFLTTSLTEGLPNTVLEAMSMEVPVIATKVGGIPEMIIHKKTGFLYDTDEVTNMANCVNMLIEDPQQRLAIAIRARKHIKNKFSFDNRLTEIEKVYNLIV